MTLKLTLLAVLFGISLAGNIPEYIHICHRGDPDVAKCIRDSIEVLRPKLKAGIPEIGVPSLEPFRIDAIELFRGTGGSTSQATIRNIEVSGAGDFEITKLKMDIPKMIYRVGIKFPVLHLDGDYDINVRVLVAPIKGTGKFHANATNCEGQALIRGEKQGTKLIFTKFDFSIKIGDYNVRLEDLFNGDKTLSEAANQLLNGNRQDFIPIITPFIERKAAEILLDAANKITKNLDYDEVFPQ